MNQAGISASLGCNEIFIFPIGMGAKIRKYSRKYRTIFVFALPMYAWHKGNGEVDGLRVVKVIWVGN